jgi:hypothetical protein
MDISLFEHDLFAKTGFHLSGSCCLEDGASALRAKDISGFQPEVFGTIMATAGQAAASTKL